MLARGEWIVRLGTIALTEPTLRLSTMAQNTARNHTASNIIVLNNALWNKYEVWIPAVAT